MTAVLPPLLLPQVACCGSQEWRKGPFLPNLVSLGQCKKTLPRGSLDTCPSDLTLCPTPLINAPFKGHVCDLSGSQADHSSACLHRYYTLCHKSHTLMRMPFFAAMPVPTITAVGVASARAHGQATTSTAMPNSSANRNALLPIGNHAAGNAPVLPGKH